MKKAGLLLISFLGLAGFVQGQVPDLVDTWKGDFTFTKRGEPYWDDHIRLVIQDQEDALFEGYFVFRTGQTNWFTGTLNPSLTVSNAYEVSIVSTARRGVKATGTALLVTLDSPYYMTRVVLHFLTEGPPKVAAITARGELVRQ